MWELQSTPHFKQRLKQYQKSRRNEVRNALANLNTYYGCLCEGTNPLQIPRFGFMHNDKHGCMQWIKRAKAANWPKFGSTFTRTWPRGNSGF